MRSPATRPLSADPPDALDGWAHGSARRYRGESPAHRHDHAQVLFGRTGCLELEVGGRAARVEAGTGLVIPPGAVHGFAAPAGACVWVVDAAPCAALDRLARFALPPGWRPAAAGPVADLIWAGDAPRIRARRRLPVDAITAAVDAALHVPWPTARLAALAGLSAPRFHARWRAVTGLTPQDWLRERRLARAGALRRAGLDLEAAALAVGYASASALAHARHRVRGA